MLLQHVVIGIFVSSLWLSLLTMLQHVTISPFVPSLCLGPYEICVQLSPVIISVCELVLLLFLFAIVSPAVISVCE
jgi:hypothetical protein